MASATITLKDKSDANIVYTLVGQTANGALYKNATRPLTTPQTLEFQFLLGSPGSLGNDKVVIILRDSNADATGKVVTLQNRMEMSIPRSTAISTGRIEDMFAQNQALFVDANCEALADALVP